MHASLIIVLVLGVYSTLQCQPISPPPLFNYSQQLHHKDPSLGVFNQRVQVIDLPHTNYTTTNTNNTNTNGNGSAVLFYAGPENASTNYTLPCTFLYEWAKQVGASAIIGVEHRFFGTSWPEGVTEANYRQVMATLTLDNILQDYISIIQHYTDSRTGRYPNARVITFGGSYGGFLSAMLRINYPDTVFASIASAAPVSFVGGVDPGLWYDTVADIYNSHDQSCAAAIKRKFHDLYDMFNQQKYNDIQKGLQLCAVPTKSSLYTLMMLPLHAAQTVVEFNYPFKSAAKVPFPYDAVCKEFLSQQDSLAALRTLLDIGYNNSLNLKCFGASKYAMDEHEEEQTKVIMPMLGSAYPNANGRLKDISFEKSWYYITCTFFGMPIAGGARAKDLFAYAPTYSLDGVNNYCEQTLFWPGVKLQSTPPLNQSMIDGSSRIIFSNMAFDPVKAFSIQHDVSATVKLKLIDNAAHTQDIIAFDTAEQAEIMKARVDEAIVMKQWLSL